MSSRLNRLRRRGAYTKNGDLKRSRRKKSSTPGKDKGLTCQKFWWKNLYCSSRSYRQDYYVDWCVAINRLNNCTSYWEVLIK